MGGISRYEKTALAVTAAVLVLLAGWFWFGRQSGGNYTVTALEMNTPAPVEREDGWPDSLLPGERIDLNAAPAADLARLPGIGEKRSADIVAWREENGPFQSVEELTNVSGIGGGTLERLRDYITVNQ